MAIPSSPSCGGNRRPAKSPRPPEELFPAKLYEMLDESEAADSCIASAVSWRSHGRAFAINDRTVFTEEVMPRFFKATKLRSFQRQLHLWGFHRILTGRDAGAWWHPLFVRGHQSLLRNIVRTRVKGAKAQGGYVEAPNFYKLGEAPTSEETGRTEPQQGFVSSSSSGSGVDEIVEDMFNEPSGGDFESSNDALTVHQPRRVTVVNPTPDSTPTSVERFELNKVLPFPSLADDMWNDNMNNAFKRRAMNWTRHHPDANVTEATTDVLSFFPVGSSICIPRSGGLLPSSSHSSLTDRDMEEELQADQDEFSLFIDQMIQDPTLI